MTQRIAAIAFIFGCTAVAWMILGSTVMSRTDNMGMRSGDKVHALWGGPQRQAPATATGTETHKELEEVSDGKGGFKKHEVERSTNANLSLEQTRARVNVHLDYRQKGLLWFSTYTSDFAASYRFRNNTEQLRQVGLTLPYPAGRAVYENLTVKVNGVSAAANTNGSFITAKTTLAPGETALFEVGFRSHGTENWAYAFNSDPNQVAQLRDFELKMTTDFKNIDFPDETLPPTEKHEAGEGWELTWRYESLVSGFNIGVQMPEKLQPGPLVERISYFAPVSLFLFFFLMMVITTMRGIDLHPMNYFFLAAAFFAFHLLLAYLVDHISIHLAMVICSVVSVFLVVSYLRVVVGPSFAFREAALGQIVYLVLFAYAFFWQGYTALSVTVVAIITLFVVMQVTARVNWTEKFRPVPPPPQAGLLR